MPASLPDPRDPTALIRIPTRHDVRRIAAEDHQALIACAGRGENPHQVALDQRDRLHAYALLLERAHGATTAAAFLGMYAEELTAANRHLATEMLAPRPTPPRGDWSDGSDWILRVGVGVVALVLLTFLCARMP